MSSSRIEQIIEEIEDYVEGCRFQPLSSTKIVVNKEELQELLRELRLKTPDEIKRYQKIISNKDAILTDAQAKADAIIQEAQVKAQQMVQQTEIMKQAFGQANDTINNANAQAQEILDSAQEDANNIRMSAISYTDELLGSISTVVGNTLADANERFSGLFNTLQNCYDVVNQNRRQLNVSNDLEDEHDFGPAAGTTGKYEEDDDDDFEYEDDEEEDY
ncbi:MAG: ATPase [Eubacterium sp.]|nr:ATPase [Eubacterium sp.]